MTASELLDADLRRWWKVCKTRAAVNEKNGESCACVVCGVTEARLASQSIAPGTVVCAFFLKGTCKRGEKCKFVHNEATSAVSEVSEVGTGTAAMATEMAPCPECQAVFFCGEACQKEAMARGMAQCDPCDAAGYRGGHNEQDCHELQLFGASKDIIDSEELEKGHPTWLPYKDLTTAYTDPKQTAVHGWKRYCEARDMPGFSEPFLALATESLSFPMSILHAAGALRDAGFPNPCARGEVILHVIGAEWETEGEGPEKWMELLHLLPSVTNVRVVLVGPTLPTEAHLMTQECCAMLAPPRAEGEEEQEEEEEQDLTEGRPYTVESYVGSYEEYVKSEEYSTPNLAVAFHPGLADYKKEWSGAIEVLLERNVPMLLTHYHKHEAEFDARTLETSFGAHVLVAASPNPYRSLLPMPDPLFEGRVYYSNNYHTLVRGRAADGRAAEDRSVKLFTKGKKKRGKAGQGGDAEPAAKKPNFRQ
jgi:hypothetical protein